MKVQEQDKKIANKRAAEQRAKMHLSWSNVFPAARVAFDEIQRDG
jgi:hypothetical protein